MHKNDHNWASWAQKLNGWGLGDLAATWLEASGPLNVVAAQLLYLGQPALRGLLAEEPLGDLAALLEDERQTQAFAAYLRDTAA